eukprot:Hpha_TRINITY_DN14883_c0_g1::TRINITY_DN14883_c0_g1_i1::g.169074::m.169074
MVQASGHCDKSSTDLLPLLLKHGGDVNAVGYKGWRSENTNTGMVRWTPLTKAIHVGSLPTVSFLLEKGADPNAGRALIFAIDCRQGEIVGALVEGGANVSEALPSGDTPLSLAAFMGNVESVRCLLTKGADPNQPGASAMPPLFWAIQSTDTVVREVVEMLVLKGADVNHTTPSGETPLHRAACVMDPVSIKFLVKHGADPNKGDMPPWLNMLWDRGIALGAPYTWGTTCRWSGIQHWELVPYSEDYSGKPGETWDHREQKQKEQRWRSRVLEGVEDTWWRGYGSDKAIVLTGAGERVLNAFMVQGNVLECAARRRLVNVVLLMLSNGADPNRILPGARLPLLLYVVKRSRCSPYCDSEYEACNCSREYIAKLIRAGCNPNTTDASGVTPCMIAAERGMPDVLEELLAAGGVPTCGSRDGATPLSLALREGRGEVVSLLLNYEGVVGEFLGIMARRSAR